MRDDDTTRRPQRLARTDPYVALVDGSRHGETVRHRVTARDATERSLDLVTLRTAVQDLAETRAAISVRLVDGRDLSGTLVGAGTDHLALRAGRRSTLVRLAPIASLVSTQREAERPPSRGHVVDRDVAEPTFDAGAPLLDVLADLRAAVDQVTVGSLGRADPLRGRLQVVGDDVVVLTLSGRVRAMVTVAGLTDVSWGAP